MRPMMLEMMNAKIHGMAVTDKDLHYTGSLGVDANILETAGILPFEKVQVINLANGARMWTYAIREEPGSGRLVLNGGMAHRGEVGDLLLIITYAQMTAEAAPAHEPKVLIMNPDNSVQRITNG